MEPTNDTKMQIHIAVVVLLSSIGVALGGQWLFEKCFGKKDKKIEKTEIVSVADTLNRADSLRIGVSDSLLQKQK